MFIFIESANTHKHDVSPLDIANDEVSDDKKTYSTFEQVAIITA